MNVQEQRGNNGKLPGGVTGNGFRPGRSGNPGGRPKGQSLTALLRAQLDKGNNAQALAKVIVDKALSGDIQFCKLILERLEGKAPDRIAGPDDEEARVQLILAEEQLRMLEDPELMELACKLDAALARGRIPDVAGKLVFEGGATMVVDGKAYGGRTPLDL